MSAFTYPARFTAGRDGSTLVQFIDFPRIAIDGNDDLEAMEEAIDAPLSIAAFKKLLPTSFKYCVICNLRRVINK